MKKEIKGSIPYTINIDGDKWDISYTSSIDNDIAALSISQMLLENFCIELKQQRSTTKFKIKKALGEQLEKCLAAQKGLKIMTDFILPSYETYMDKLQNSDEIKKEEKLTDL